ncbi:MAG: DMT family transporter [Solirubrobacteraceae bacterium]
MTRRHWLFMGGAAAMWGASYLFIKVALRDFSEGSIVCIRTALGAAVLLTLAARWDALAPLRGRLGSIVLVSIPQVTAPFLLITYGEGRIDSQLAGILVSSAPIFTALLALGVDADERVHGWGAVGIVVGMLGVVLLFGADLTGSSGALVGGLMVLAAGFGYAAGALLMKRRLRGAPPVGVAGASMTVAALMTLPLLIAAPPDHAPRFEAWGSLVLLGAGGTGIAFLFFYTLIAELGPSRASVIAYIAPGFSVVYGVALLGEPFRPAAVAGLVLILGGSWLAIQSRRPSLPSRSALSRWSVRGLRRAPRTPAAASRRGTGG